jgi:hypothetical protein
MGTGPNIIAFKEDNALVQPNDTVGPFSFKMMFVFLVSVLNVPILDYIFRIYVSVMSIFGTPAGGDFGIRTAQVHMLVNGLNRVPTLQPSVFHVSSSIGSFVLDSIIKITTLANFHAAYGAVHFWAWLLVCFLPHTVVITRFLWFKYRENFISLLFLLLFVICALVIWRFRSSTSSCSDLILNSTNTSITCL